MNGIAFINACGKAHSLDRLPRGAQNENKHKFHIQCEHKSCQTSFMLLCTRLDVIILQGCLRE